jgi:hypothetical protein
VVPVRTRTGTTGVRIAWRPNGAYALGGITVTDGEAQTMAGTEGLPEVGTPLTIHLVKLRAAVNCWTSASPVSGSWKGGWYRT